MSEPAQPDNRQAAPDQTPQASFQIDRLYVKDLSLEVPNAPQIFMQPEAPQLEVTVRNDATQFADSLFEVTVTVTVTARSGEKTVFLAEVAQAGIFSARGIAPQDLQPLLAVACPTILFPYAREAISDLVTRAGFPAVVLAPVSFEQLYMQGLQQQAAVERKIEVAS